MRLIIIAVSLLIAVNAQAMELDASWYSVQSLKNEGTWKYSKGVMANGNIFSDNGLTCACWSYKLGSLVRVTNIDNGKTVIVKVTDRTARRFKGKRIDLSKGAFSKIADLKQGLTRVTVREL